LYAQNACLEDSGLLASRLQPSIPPALQKKRTLQCGHDIVCDNIIATLKQPNRVSCINLTITRPFLSKIISMIEGPFSERDELVLLSQDNMQLAMPSAFRWGPHIRRHLYWIYLFPQLNSVSSNKTTGTSKVVDDIDTYSKKAEI
jgi:hypothetical protein